MTDLSFLGVRYGERHICRTDTPGLQNDANSKNVDFSLPIGHLASPVARRVCRKKMHERGNGHLPARVLAENQTWRTRDISVSGKPSLSMVRPIARSAVFRPGLLRQVSKFPYTNMYISVFHQVLPISLFQ